MPPKLDATHRAFLARIVEEGPTPAIHGVVRWRACDLIMHYTRSSGSRCRTTPAAVVIPIMTQHYPMLQRSLLCAGVMRGRKLLVLVSQKKAVAIAVRNVSGRRRWSKLVEWLLRAHPPASNGKTGNDRTGMYPRWTG